MTREEIINKWESRFNLLEGGQSYNNVYARPLIHEFLNDIRQSMVHPIDWDELYLRCEKDFKDEVRGNQVYNWVRKQPEFQFTKTIDWDELLKKYRDKYELGTADLQYVHIVNFVNYFIEFQLTKDISPVEKEESFTISKIVETFQRVDIHYTKEWLLRMLKQE